MIKWARKNVDQWVCFEQAVYSRTHMYAGTTDALAVVDGKQTLIDFKTSNHFHASYHLQINAYTWAEWSEHEALVPSKIKQAKVLHLNKQTGDWHEYPIPLTKRDFQLFLSCRTIYPWWKENEEAYAKTKKVQPSASSG